MRNLISQLDFQVALTPFVFSLASMNFFWRSSKHVQKVDQGKTGFVLVFFRETKSAK